MEVLEVSEAFEITGQGVALFFKHDPDPIPEYHKLRIKVIRPDATVLETVAYREFARRMPLGEIVAFLLPEVRMADVPVGSTITIVAPEVDC
jgi:hypothetical protein